MKWVTIGGVFAVGGGIAASVYSDDPAPFIGSALIAGAMFAFYVHAKNTGLKNGGTPTESYY